MDIRESIIRAVVTALQEQVSEEVVNTVQDVLVLELNQYEVQERCTAVTVSDNSEEGLLKRYVATKRDVAQILGHADLKTTQVYCFISLANVKAAYRKFAA